jgi:16S rRNA (guanine527-N7)-methyltransferase
MSPSISLQEGLRAMGLEVDDEAQRKLAAHLDLLAKWNRVHNLTAVRESGQMVVLHVLYSLSLVPHLGSARTLLDVGTGAGFPGVPLAIVRPDIDVTAIDSSHKKCAFLEQVKADLALSNLTVVCERVERWQPARKFDIVVSRAFAELSDFVSQAAHLVVPGGRMLAMKGVHPFEEIARVPASHRVSQVIELKVPSLDARRHLVFLEAA